MRISITSALLVLSLALCGQVFSQLSILNPQQQWRGTWPGSIDTALVTVRMAGVYAEVNLYLTIYDAVTQSNSGEQYEITLDFDQPSGAVVHDSWLWVDDTIIQAQILDRWTAANIYEGIVSRQRDPSILYKLGADNYQLRIYPLFFRKYRKVRISYLVPANWNPAAVEVPLPTEVLEYSDKPINDLKFLFWEDPKFGTPQLAGLGQSLTPGQDPSGRKFFGTSIQYSDLSKLKALSLDSPMENGAYLSTYTNGDDNFYQLAYYPSFLFDKLQPRKVAVVFDYDATRTSIPKTLIYNAVKQKLENYLGAVDSFNFFYGSLLVRNFGNQWLAADSSNFEKYFTSTVLADIGNYTNFQSNISAAIQFIKNNGGEGDILLVSSSEQYGSFQVANEFLNEILKVTGADIPIHILYLQNRNYNYNWINNRYYYGSEYLYTNLSQLTGGNYFSILSDGTAWGAGLDRILQNIGVVNNLVELNTSLAAGICFSRYTPGAGVSLATRGKASIQVGKYLGSFPFQVQAIGILDDKVYSATTSITASQVTPIDTLAEEVWYGNRIYDLEQQYQSNAIISQIIRTSLEERVLSTYTAFLCLEPSFGGEPCLTCFDETDIIIIGTDDLAANDTIRVHLFPNPFADQVQIEVTLSENVRPQDCCIAIHDLMGRTVRVLGVPQNSEMPFTLTWDGHSDAGSQVQGGLYLVVVSTPYGKKSAKLLYRPE